MPTPAGSSSRRAARSRRRRLHAPSPPRRRRPPAHPRRAPPRPRPTPRRPRRRPVPPPTRPPASSPPSPDHAMTPKGPTLSLRNLQALLHQAATATLAAALLATAALTITPQPSQAATYHHLSLNYAGYANADGWTAHADHQGRGYIASTLHATGTLGLWNIDGGRPGGFQSPEYTSFVYDAPADTTISHIYWTDRISGLGSGPWQH